MIHDPLLFIDKLEIEAKDRALTREEWYRLRSDMNSAVCYLMIAQESPRGLSASALEMIRTFLNSQPEQR